MPLIVLGNNIVVDPIQIGLTCKLREQKTRFRSPSNSTAVLNLICSLVLNSSLSFMFFHRVKEPKRPAQNKISHNSLLLTSRNRHPSVGCCLPLKASRCHSGAPELVRFSVINNKITLPHFKHILACSLNVNGL